MKKVCESVWDDWLNKEYVEGVIDRSVTDDAFDKFKAEWCGIFDWQYEWVAHHMKARRDVDQWVDRCIIKFF